jgi:hypothetical protein
MRDDDIRDILEDMGVLNDIDFVEHIYVGG